MNILNERVENRTGFMTDTAAGIVRLNGLDLQNLQLRTFRALSD